MADKTLCQAGIYCITHVPSGLLYIGSSNNIHRRWNAHRNALRKRSHPTKRLQAAWDSDGPAAFAIAVIEPFPGWGNTRKAIQHLTEREQAWIDKINPCCPTIGFNISSNAAGGCCTGRLSAEARAVISVALQNRPKSAAHRAKIGAAHVGRVPSDDARLAMSNAAVRRFAQPGARDYLAEPHSPETIQKIAAAARGRPVSPGAGAKISAANKGRKFAPGIYDSRIALHTGRKHTSEALAKMSAAAKSRSPEHRAKISAANKLRGAANRAAAVTRSAGETITTILSQSPSLVIK
jgi:group I intron endonuclease